MSAHYSYINQAFIAKEAANLSVSDLAIQRGYGIFDFLTTINHLPICLDAHLARFYQSAKAMHLNVPLEKKALIAVIDRLIQKNNLPNSGIRMTLTGGESADGYSIGKPNLIITQSPFVYRGEMFTKGLKLITYEHQRQLPHIKTIDYLKAIYLQPTIQLAQADDVLYHYNGLVTECPRANFFIVTEEETIITPETNILEGVTRQLILNLKGHKLMTGAITLEQLKTAKEAFVSSSTKQILPVLSINGQILGNGQPGPITSALFKQLIELKGILI